MIGTRDRTDTPWGPRPRPKPRPKSIRPPKRGPHFPKLGGTWDEIGPHYPQGPHTGGPEPF